MCWSIEVSLLTGIFSYCVSFYAWMRNYKYDRWAAVILFTFSSIQFAEAILWYDNSINGLHANSKTNLFVTKFLIPFILALEPLAMIYGASLYTYVDKNLFVMYIIISCCIFISLLSGYNYTKISKKGHLQWGSTPSPVDGQKSDALSLQNDILQGIFFCFLLVLPIFLYVKENIFKYILIGIITFTLLLSYRNANNAWGSHWCLYANAIAILLLFYPLI
jgi:hypothetical protein